MDGIEIIAAPLEDLSDQEFWPQWGEFLTTPLYYNAFLEHFPIRTASVLATIAAANNKGGLLFHCAVGRDRTGLIALLLLALAGAKPDEIVADYELSEHRLGRELEQNNISALLVRENTSVRQAILALLSVIDGATYMQQAGLSETEINSLRSRMMQSG
jgi:protein-tyrosine phosphatase